MLKQLTEKIYELLPDLFNPKDCYICKGKNSSFCSRPHEQIGLPEVLRAIEKKDNSNDYELHTDGSIFEMIDYSTWELKCKWDLTKDLNNQSEETIKFLWGIFG